MENSCCLRLGFLAYPMIRDPKTVPIPAPDPATPTVAAPAPMNLAALSMSCLADEVERRAVEGRVARRAGRRRGQTTRRVMAAMTTVVVDDDSGTTPQPDRNGGRWRKADQLIP